MICGEKWLINSTTLKLETCVHQENHQCNHKQATIQLYESWDLLEGWGWIVGRDMDEIRVTM